MANVFHEFETGDHNMTNDDKQKKILKDGERLRVEMQMMDSLQRSIHDRYYADAKPAGWYPPSPGLKAGQSCMADNGRPGHFEEAAGGFVCVANVKEDAMTNDDQQPLTVVDAFGNDGLALNKPGSRYAVAGARTVDHALQVAREVERQNAFADSIADHAISKGPFDDARRKTKRTDPFGRSEGEWSEEEDSIPTYDDAEGLRRKAAAYDEMVAELTKDGIGKGPVR
jgi:hypothetical protein